MEENLKIPAHVALILDGNGNSEMERFLPYKSVGYVPGKDIEAEQLNRREGNRR